MFAENARSVMTVNSLPVVRALVESLRDDPFYRAITAGAADETERDAMLERYFDYSMSEGAQLGRCTVQLQDAPGAAVWLLPNDADKAKEAKRAKIAMAREVLGEKGTENYI